MGLPESAPLQDDGFCFACGKDNPHGLGMRVEYGEQKASCRITLPRHFQGWSGIAHGGVVATLLDEIMAHAVIHFVGQAVTASMETRYRKPVPLGSDLLAEGWVDQLNRRVAIAKARVSLAKEDVTLAEGAAKFILRPEGGQGA